MLPIAKPSVFDADQSAIFWLFFSQWRIYPADERYWHGPRTVTFEIRILASALAIWIRVISARAPVHVTNATLNMNPECRLVYINRFSVDE